MDPPIQTLLTEAIWCDQSSQLPNTQLLSPSVRFSGGDEAIIQMELNKVKSLNWWEANFTSVAEDLNSGLPRTNPASGNGAGLELGPPKYKSISGSFSDQEKKKRANSKERWGCKVIASRTMLFYFHAESLSARGEDQIL